VCFQAGYSSPTQDAIRKEFNLSLAEVSLLHSPFSRISGIMGTNFENVQ